MSISTIEESEIPEHFDVFTLVHCRKPADAVGSNTLAAPGHHPKCRIVKVESVCLAYSTAADVYDIEDGDGNLATAASTVGAAIGVSAEATLVAGQVFERNEAIVHELTTDGNAANAYIVFVTCESIH